jgi:hypothetical protein
MDLFQFSFANLLQNKNMTISNQSFGQRKNRETSFKCAEREKQRYETRTLTKPKMKLLICFGVNCSIYDSSNCD